MTDLSLRIKELETKYREQLKADKAKLMTDYRNKQKKMQESDLKRFVKTCLDKRKLFNDDDLFFGCLLNGLESINKSDQQKLDYFRGLVHKENKPA